MANVSRWMAELGSGRLDVSRSRCAAEQIYHLFSTYTRGGLSGFSVFGTADIAVPIQTPMALPNRLRYSPDGTAITAPMGLRYSPDGTAIHRPKSKWLKWHSAVLGRSCT
jgi:hypothetical protein